MTHRLLYRRNMPNYELLRELYAIIDGIPEEQFNLDEVVSGGKPSCKGICCAIGWASFHPTFRALGLKWDKKKGLVFQNTGDATYDQVASWVFDISAKDAYDIFCPADCSRYDFNNDSPFDHKELFKYRVRKFLVESNQPVRGV